MNCGACGANNEATARFCHSCGNPMTARPAPPLPPPLNPGTMRAFSAQAATPAAPGSNAALPAILSALIPGVGQFYNGDTKKGALMLGVAVVLFVFTLGLSWLGMAIWGAIDAYQVASGTGKKW